MQWLFRDLSLPINTGSLKCLSDQYDTHPYLQGRVGEEKKFKCKKKNYIGVMAGQHFQYGFQLSLTKLKHGFKNEFLT